MIAALVAIILAQTTNCYPNNPIMPSAGMHCDTTPDASQLLQQNQPAAEGGPDRAPSSLEECAIGGLRAMADGCTFTQIAKAKKNAANRSAVGNLIADGKCADARNYALRAGDLELAEHVSTLCAGAK